MYNNAASGVVMLIRIQMWLYGNSLITIYNIYFWGKESKTSEVPNQRKG
jgi:hypothetical protein